MSKQQRLTDEELVVKFRAGEEDAFRDLVSRYQSALINYIYRFTARRELAEEVTQETFMTVFQNLDKFDDTASFRPWLYAIATNRALNSTRRRSPIYNDEALQESSSNLQDPLQNASEKERAQAVQQALATLPEKQRAIFILRFYQQLSYEEIAVATGCPVGTVKSRVCYALKKLRGILQWLHTEE